MIEIRIPKEIKDFKEKLFFNLTLRQTICSVLVIAINVPLYVFGKDYISSDLLSWIVIGIALVIFLAGFFNYNAMNFEEFIHTLFKYSFLHPQKRKYGTKNLYEILDENDREKNNNAKNNKEKNNELENNKLEKNNINNRGSR